MFAISKPTPGETTRRVGPDILQPCLLASPPLAQRFERGASGRDFHVLTIKSDVESLTLTRPDEDLRLSWSGDEMPEVFSENLLRMIAAVLYQMLTQQTAREMFGKSYMALGAAEKLSLEQAVFQMVASSYQAITPENLRSQQQHKPQAGFQTKTAEK